MKPTNSDDVIDSRDILDYIKDKENDRDFELENFIKDFRDEHSDYDKALENLEFGITFIRDSYFEDYMLDYFLQFNQIDEALLCYIDIESFARNQQYDYTSIDFDGIEYWYHNC
tara:strand:+ start:216 stop:557 length:342 start_codon:yes stop_codon:yes gene_type:complete